MTTAYGSASVDVASRGDTYANLLKYVPLEMKLKDETPVTVDFLRTSTDENAVRTLLNDRIEEGMSWPFSKALTEEEFRNYFFAHTALVVRAPGREVIGAFYCKPNFPGRCSHICNGGFITDPGWRRRGVATAMATAYLRIAKDLGFDAALFNLVFASNIASVRLWDKMGFTRIAVLPKCAYLRSGISDAYQYYYDLNKDWQP